MTIEQRLQLMLGQQLFTIAMLQAQLEDAQKRIAELEAKAKAAE